MSSFLLDLQIQKDFKFYEFITGTYNTMPKEASILALENLTEEVCQNIIKVSELAQEIRDYFEDSLIITCGFRPLVWELKQGRTGKSLHALGLAMDCYLTHIKLEDLFVWFNKKYTDKYGRAINKKLNFCHFDLRPNCVSWNY